MGRITFRSEAIELGFSRNFGLPATIQANFCEHSIFLRFD